MLGRRAFLRLNLAALLAALLLAVASALPWEDRVTIAGAHSVSGLQLGGAVTLPLALFAGATSVAAAITGRARFAVPSAIAGIAAAAVATRDFARLAQTRYDVIDNASEPMLGVLLAAVAGVLLACLAAAAVALSLRSAGSAGREGRPDR
jgi:hypothetical protein